jgi:hypothetical protein
MALGFPNLTAKIHLIARNYRLDIFVFRRFVSIERLRKTHNVDACRNLAGWITRKNGVA